MERLYFICDDLNAMETAQNELLSIGFRYQQVHVLSNDDRPLLQHHLHPLERIWKSDFVRSTLIGAAAGLVLAGVILLVAWASGTGEATSMMLFVAAAVALVAILAVEGGLLGFNRLNHRLRCFERQLRRGFHVMIVDFKPTQRAYVQAMYDHHPQLAMAAMTAH